MLLKLKVVLLVYATAVAGATALKCKAYFGAGAADVDIASPTNLCADTAAAEAEQKAGAACAVHMGTACTAHPPSCYWEVECQTADDCYRSQEQQPVFWGPRSLSPRVAQQFRKYGA